MTATLELRDYQRDALDRTHAAVDRGVLRQLGVAATGLGKTIIFCALARERGGRTLVIVHRDELVRQAWQKVRESWPDVEVGIVKGPENDIYAQVVIASVQTLSRPKRLGQLIGAMTPTDGGLGLAKLADPIRTVIVDEAHHAHAVSYRTVIDALGAGEPDGPLLIGVTATPDRGDGNGLDDLFTEIVWNYDILWGIRSGFLCDVRAKRVTIDALNLNNVKVSRGDFEQGAVGRALTDADAPNMILRAWQEHASDRRTLAFMPTVALAREMSDVFRHAGVAAGWVSGETPLEERRNTLSSYSDGVLQVLVNCMVLTEGYDEPRTDCIIQARPTKNRALFCFDHATEVLTPDGWVKGGTAIEGSTIAAFDPESGEVRWEHVAAHINRPLLDGERMMRLSSPSIDLRVTDTHRMVWRKRVRRSRERSPWMVSTAGELAAWPDVWELPVAGVEKTSGVPLTDAEVAFIGWVQTDGTVNRKTLGVRISQSSGHTEQCVHIEKTLDACGFKWRMREDTNPTNYGERSHPIRQYTVSFGKPRGADKHLRGWGALAAWMPKLSSNDAWRRLESMDCDQWRVFLDAWHRGDGSKQAGQSWTRRSYHLAVGDEWVAGWIQGMCVRRGWRSNVVRQPTVWMVHCRERDARYVGGATSTDRPHFIEDTATQNERVWCVSVPSGALIVRRNGKAAIAGNTQMIGRGTRKHPDKDDLLVLDVAGSSETLSLVTVPSLLGLPRDFARTLEDGTGLLADVAQAYDDDRVRAGLMRAEDADLFKKMRGTKIAWVAVHHDGERRRYEMPLSNRDENGDRVVLPTVVVTQADDTHADGWLCGLVMPDRTKRVLIKDVSLELAQGVGEDAVRKLAGGRTHLIDPDAPWRKRKPSQKQRTAAQRMKIPHVETYKTAGDLSDAITAHLARSKNRRAGTRR